MRITRRRLKKLIETVISEETEAPQLEHLKDVVSDEFNWTKLPSRSGRYLMLNYDDVMRLKILPVGGVNPQAYKRDFWTLESSQWGASGDVVRAPKLRLRQIDSWVFGGPHQHQYTRTFGGFEIHPTLKKPMYPPQWTIQFVEGGKRADIIKKKLVSATTDEEKYNIATKQGWEPNASGLRGLESALERFDASRAAIA